MAWTSKRAAYIYEGLRRTRPKTRQDLKNYVKVFLGIDVPDKKICPDHNSPMDYLWHSFSADFPTCVTMLIPEGSAVARTHDARRTTQNEQRRLYRLGKPRRRQNAARRSRYASRLHLQTRLQGQNPRRLRRAVRQNV